jgi:hypothetical protein
MAPTVEAFKNEWQQKIKSKPEEYFKDPRISASNKGDITVTFGSDKAIQNHIDGKSATAGVCCIVCAKGPFGIKICVVPPGGDCDNMCL